MTYRGVRKQVNAPYAHAHAATKGTVLVENSAAGKPHDGIRSPKEWQTRRFSLNGCMDMKPESRVNKTKRPNYGHSCVFSRSSRVVFFSLWKLFNHVRLKPISSWTAGCMEDSRTGVGAEQHGPPSDISRLKEKKLRLGLHRLFSEPHHPQHNVLPLRCRVGWREPQFRVEIWVKFKTPGTPRRRLLLQQ